MQQNLSEEDIFWEECPNCHMEGCFQCEHTGIVPHICEEDKHLVHIDF
jgi:hypothetical protein